MSDMLPCPFCSSDVSEDDCFVVVTCPVCGAKGPEVHGKDANEAIALWNRRRMPEIRIAFGDPAPMIDGMPA